MSDLHLEFLNGAEQFVPPETQADVIVLAGDIHMGTKGIEWALNSLPSKPIVYVLGNHEHYGGHIDKSLGELRAAAAGTSVHVLENDVFVYSGVRFLGATLWTDFRFTGNEILAQWDALQTIKDYQKIDAGLEGSLKPFMTAAIHAKSREFLEQALEIPFDGKTVVVTHHAPSELSISSQYQQTGGHLNASFASRLEGLFRDSVPLWVHGHMHDSLSYELFGTSVVCNPRGYSPSRLNPKFDPGLVLEI